LGQVSHLLSKTSFLRGQQCPKALFLYKYYPHLRDPMPPERLAILRRGNDVGFLARKLFPGGEDASSGAGPRIPGSTSQSRSMEAVARTQEFMQSAVNVIYEATFIHNEILVMIDILVRDGNEWRMYEVKSGLRVSPHNITDAALQFAVARGAGVPVTSVSLVHLNQYYKRRGELNLEQLFNIVDITQDAFNLETGLMHTAEEQKLVLGLPQAPEVAIGGRCFLPYECDFRGQCWKVQSEYSTFQLAGIPKSEQGRLYDSGITDYRSLSASQVGELPKMTTLQVRTAQQDKTHIDRESIRSFIHSLGGELLFVDIENFQPAIPRYEGTSPFMQLPFGYSAHHLSPDGTLTQHVFIVEPGTDPRREFLIDFLKATEGTCRILAYDVSAETQILKLLRKAFPEFAVEIDQRVSRMADLMKPFSEGWYHSPKMMGSISLKYVLPALVPELTYDNIAIKNGNHAMAVYDGLERETDLFARAEKLDALREYCTLDTLAMVRIYQVLAAAGA
jgi:hypothetical protein